MWHVFVHVEHVSPEAPGRRAGSDEPPGPWGAVECWTSAEDDAPGWGSLKQSAASPTRHTITHMQRSLLALYKNNPTYTIYVLIQMRVCTCALAHIFQSSSISDSSRRSCSTTVDSASRWNCPSSPIVRIDPLQQPSNSVCYTICTQTHICCAVP